MAIKPETIADVLVVGFAELEKSRGPHWKRTKTECQPFAAAVAAVIPELPAEVLKTIEKTAPWVSLATTAFFLFAPGIMGELAISKMQQQQEEAKRRVTRSTQPTNNQPTSNQQPGTVPDPTGGNSASSPDGRTAPGGSGEKRAAPDNTTAEIGGGVPPFGKFGQSAL